MAIYPTSEQIQALLAGPADRPVVMLNLLRFKPRADAPDGGLTGEEAYRRYARAMRASISANSDSMSEKRRNTVRIPTPARAAT